MIHTTKKDQDFLLHLTSILNGNECGDTGQSLIEFLICFIFAFGILLLGIKVAFNLTNGYMAHYATYVASRVYLVSDNNSNNPSNSDKAAFKEAKIGTLSQGQKCKIDC